VANSAATLCAPDARYDAVRCGIALYGVSPFDADPAADGLRPALRLTSRVTQLRMLQAGESSGYGRRLVAVEPTRVAIVPVGYADGYPRVLSGRSDVLIRGRRRRVAATVSMDQLTCVVSGDVEVGDEVVLLGEQAAERVGAEELAGLAGTIGYEIVCGLRHRPGRSARIVHPV
jgi:alanine racemase